MRNRGPRGNIRPHPVAFGDGGPAVLPYQNVSGTDPILLDRSKPLVLIDMTDGDPTIILPTGDTGLTFFPVVVLGTIAMDHLITVQCASGVYQIFIEGIGTAPTVGMANLDHMHIWVLNEAIWVLQ